MLWWNIRVEWKLHKYSYPILYYNEILCLGIENLVVLCSRLDVSWTFGMKFLWSSLDPLLFFMWPVVAQQITLITIFIIMVVSFGLPSNLYYWSCIYSYFRWVGVFFRDLYIYVSIIIVHSRGKPPPTSFIIQCCFF